MNPALAGVALAILIGAITAASSRDARIATLAMLAVLASGCTNGQLVDAGGERGAGGLAFVLLALFFWIFIGAIFYMGFRRTGPAMPSNGAADVVKVGSAPNVPFAEMIVAELRGSGVSAFYKVTGASYATSVTALGNGCDVYVARGDAERAQAIFRSAQATDTPDVSDLAD